MNYIHGDECAKAIQEYRNLSKDFINERQWAIKYLDLYKKICVKNDRLETDLTITREHMENTMDFLIAYELNKFDDDLDNALHNVVPN